jgi:Big-like domain-containing protein
VFLVSGANSRGPTSVTTDSNGQAQYCYTGQNAGDDTISAYADMNDNNSKDSGEPDDMASKTWTAAAPATLSLSPQTATNTVGDQHCVTATVRDSFGNPTPSVSVVFSVSGANDQDSSSVSTDASGQSQLCYTGTSAGDDTISAYADTDQNSAKDTGEPSDSASKTWNAAAPDSLSLSPQTATNWAGTEHCLTATVRDSFGNPTPNVSVVFSVSGANNRGPSFVATDSSGQSQFCYTGQYPGDDTISAYADTNQNSTKDTGEPSDTAAKTYTAGDPANLALSPKTATNGVGERHCVTATVTDAYANPTPSIDVVFTVTGANASSPTSAATDSSGQSQFCYTGQKAGDDTIDAFADTNQNGAQDTGEPSDTAAKTYVATPHPVGASPLRVPLVPAFTGCESENVDSTHGESLDFGACNPPTQASTTARLGPKSIGFVNVLVCNLGATAANCGQSGLVKPDLRLVANLRDVRCADGASAGCSPGADYDPNGATGPYTTTCTTAANCNNGSSLASPYCAQSGASETDCVAGADLTETATIPNASVGGSGTRFEGRGLRITDTRNGNNEDLSATVVDVGFPIPIDCLGTPSDNAIGSTCGVNTSANALVPGVVRTGDRATWQIGEIQILDSGPDGRRGDSDDGILAVQGIYLP